MTLKLAAEKYGVENLKFVIKLRPLRGFSWFKYTTSRDKEQEVICEVFENRYKIEDGFKITLRSIDPRFGTKTYFIHDIEILIRNGRVKIFHDISNKFND